MLIVRDLYDIVNELMKTIGKPQAPLLNLHKPALQQLSRADVLKRLLPSRPAKFLQKVLALNSQVDVRGRWQALSEPYFWRQ